MNGDLLPPPPPPPPPMAKARVRRRRWWAGAAVAIVLLSITTTVLAFTLTGRVGHPAASRASIPPTAAAPLATATAPASSTPSEAATPTISPTPTPTPTPTASPSPVPIGTPPAAPTFSPESNPLKAPPGTDPNGPVDLARILYPPPPPGVACKPPGGGYAACPVTSSLASALDTFAGHQAEALCRCQNTYQAVSSARNDALLPAGDRGNAQDAAVDVRLQFGPMSVVHMVVLATRASGSWLGFDTYCDNPQNRMTSAAPGPCTPQPS